MMYLEAGTRSHFMGFLARAFPALRPRLERLYAKKHAPEAYRHDVKAMVALLQRRHGAVPVRDESERQRASPAGDTTLRTADPEQAGFDWERRG